jgi:hypothetical protein
MPVRSLEELLCCGWLWLDHMSVLYTSVFTVFGGFNSTVVCTLTNTGWASNIRNRYEEPHRTRQPITRLHNFVELTAHMIMNPRCSVLMTSTFADFRLHTYRGDSVSYYWDLA